MNYYNPRKDTAKALDRAYALVRSVDYSVSARWLFYRLLQEGFYSKKSDYKNKWLPSASKARHAGYKLWRPDTLADDTRQAIERGGGWDDPKDWIEGVSKYLSCSLDKWQSQQYYVELWFEARAMASQFEHYTDHITLRPMAGQPSIPFKYAIAQDLNDKHAQYGTDVIILYFGDLDPAGDTIAEVFERDVRKWCNVDFEFIQCGLNEEQVAQWDVPENPDKPGEFQWEALSDRGAETIITDSTSPYISHGLFEQVEEREEEATLKAQGELQTIAREW